MIQNRLAIGETGKLSSSSPSVVQRGGWLFLRSQPPRLPWAVSEDPCSGSPLKPLLSLSQLLNKSETATGQQLLGRPGHRLTSLSGGEIQT